MGHIKRKSLAFPSHFGNFKQVICVIVRIAVKIVILSSGSYKGEIAYGTVRFSHFLAGKTSHRKPTRQYLKMSLFIAISIG